MNGVKMTTDFVTFRARISYTINLEEHKDFWYLDKVTRKLILVDSLFCSHIISSYKVKVGTARNFSVEDGDDGDDWVSATVTILFGYSNHSFYLHDYRGNVIVIAV